MDHLSSTSAAQGEISGKRLYDYFVTHLNRIYCAKSHFAERLPEIYDLASFEDLKHAINETLEDVENQLLRLDEVYTLLGVKKTLVDCESLIEFAEAAFDTIHAQPDDPTITDLSILFYLHNVEMIEESSFLVLLLVAKRLKNQAIGKLLKECLDEAREDKALLLTIHERYLKKKYIDLQP